MSHYIPVFTTIVECDKLVERLLSYDQALTLVSAENWISTSRNWWYQGLIKALIGAYGGVNQLQYLTEIVSAVPAQQIDAKIEAINALVQAIRNDPAPFIAVTPWYGASAETILKNIDEAVVSRDVDDDSILAFSNFFSFLASHACALEQAQKTGKCVLYVQAQP